MTRRTLATLVIAFALAAPASAQLNRAYVSVARGTDANECSYASPCRSIGKAVSVLNSGGEAILIDGGGFAPFAIDRGVSIQAPSSVFAGVITASANAVRIDAANEEVILRGLTLTGVGAAIGLMVVQADEVYLEELIVNGFTNSGMHVDAANGVFVRRTTSRNNYYGLSASTGTAIDVNESNFDGNQHGVVASGASIMVSGSGASGNQGAGFLASTDGHMVLERCVSSFNAYGIYATNAQIDVSNSAVTFNASGLHILNGATINSRANNTVRANTSGNSFSATFGSL